MGNRHSTTSSDDSSSKHVCTTQSLAEDASQNAVGDMTFYEFNRVLAGACTAFALVVMLLFMIMHATHLSKPNKQLKILRIALIIPLYGIISYVNLVAPSAEVYLLPWLDFVQSVSLGSFFLLMCEFVAPSDAQRDVFFAALEVKDKKSPTGRQDGLLWFKKRWFFVFQYPVVSLLVAIVTDITQATGIYCQFETKIYFAKLWLGIIGKASLLIAVIAVLRFYGILKTHLAHHQPLAKLLAFKLIVGLTFLESIIFWILGDTSVLDPSAKFTWADLHIGLPNLLVCLEMVFFSLFFFYAYPVTPYLLRNQQQHLSSPEVGVTFPARYQGGPLGIRAWLGMLNFAEILQAIAFGFRMGVESRSKRGAGRAGRAEHDRMVPKPYYGQQQEEGMTYGQGPRY